ncbi:MAG: immunoglobulin domain-containing protein, partial [Planctomycetota bacterium JB042]
MFSRCARGPHLLFVLFPLVSMPSAGAQVWEAAPTFPTGAGARSHAVGVVSQGNVYAIGGPPFTTSDPDGVSHVLASGAAVWAASANVEGTIVGAGAGVDALGRIVVFGGEALIGDDEGKTYVWDPIEGKKDTLAARSGAAPVTGFAWATDDQGRLYSIGGGPGASATPSDPNVGRVERYDGATNTWTVLSPLPTPVAEAAAVFDGHGHVLVIGGFAATGGARTTNVARYSVASGNWSDSAVPDLPVPLSGARAVLGSDERIYVVGGSNGSPLATTWVLDATQTTWSAGPTLAVAREEHAAVLRSDDHLMVMGGLGTATCERLYTPPCPTFTNPPSDTTGWAGLSTSLSVEVAGGEPFSYQWRKGGIPLSDGTSVGGGFVSGSTSSTLVLSGVGDADAGEYDVVVTNACGSIASDPVEVTVRPAPTVGPDWTVSVIHPPNALSSVANAVDETTIGGAGTYPDATYGSLSHPLLWPKDGGPATDMTPAGSVGGAILDVGPGTQVGWYWWP